MGMDAHCVRTTYVSYSEGKSEVFVENLYLRLEGPETNLTNHSPVEEKKWLAFIVCTSQADPRLCSGSRSIWIHLPVRWS